MPIEAFRRVLLLPRLQQEERNGAGRVYGEPSDASIDAPEPALSAMGVTGVRPERSYSFDGGGKAAQNLAPS
jgi:hypothetical protein